MLNQKINKDIGIALPELDLESQGKCQNIDLNIKEDPNHQGELDLEDDEDEDFSDLATVIDVRLPKIQCDRGYAHSIVTNVCTVKTCGKRLLCKQCLLTDHLPLKKYSKTFKEFLLLKRDKKVIKAKNILDIEYFLEEKQQFVEKLDFAYKMATETAEKEFDALHQSISDILFTAKSKVLEFKATNYQTAKNLLDSLQPQLDDIYFDVEKQMKLLLSVKDFHEMDETIKKVIEYPDQKKIESVANDFRLISHYIKEFESDASLLVLKHISPNIEHHLSEQLQKISNEVDARRILLEQDGEESVEDREVTWNPNGVINYKTVTRNSPDPILCACEIDKQTIVFGTGQPGNSILVYNKLTHQFVDEFQAHETSVMSIIPYHDTIILSAGSDGIVKFWDIDDSENFKTFQAHNLTLMTLCKISQYSFATAGFDNTIKIWNFESGSQTPDGTLVGHTEGIFQVLLLSKEDQTLGSCSADYNVKIWNLGRLECIGTLKGHKNQVNCIDKVGDDQIISGGDDHLIILWNWRTLERVSKIECVQHSIWNLKLMSDQDCVVVTGEDLSISLLSLKKSGVVNKLFGHKSFPRSILSIASGTLLTFGYDANIKFWKPKMAEH